MILISFGYALNKMGKLDDSFVEKASRLVFNFALPALLFTSISTSAINQLANIKVITIGLVATIIMFFIILVVCNLMVKQTADKGVVIQGAFRSNMGIIGLAYCANAFGPEGLAYGSVYMGALTILYNVLSVVVLNVYQGTNFSYTKIVNGILSNPIILGICAGVTVAYFEIRLPQIVLNSAGYFAQLTLPLALLCTGAALKFSTMKQNSVAGLLSISSKCVVYPFFVVFMAILFDVTGMALMVLFFMAISPTAAASYVMVRKIGGNHELAAQIIAISTVLSVPCTLLGYMWLAQFI